MKPPFRPDPRLSNPEARGATICWQCGLEYTVGFGWLHRLVRGHWPARRSPC
jgi:hypothetical protein